MWKTPEAEVYLKVFIFNVTNHEDFLSGKDEKLKFEEVGPYIYRYFRENVKILSKYNNNNNDNSQWLRNQFLTEMSPNIFRL